MINKVCALSIFLATVITSGAISALAADCGNEASPDFLHLSYPAQSGLGQPVSVWFQLDGSNLSASFDVRNETINAEPTLGPGEYPYFHDVVELFVSVAGTENGQLPYYEFELSPYDQTFEVRFDSLKKPFIDGIDMGIEHHAQFVPGGWRGQIIVPLKNLGWDGDVSKIVGNAYSIFGVSPKRSYWSLSIPNQLKPNFHQPQFFRPFLKCATSSAAAKN